MPGTVLAIFAVWVLVSMMGGVLFVVARWWLEHHRERPASQSLTHIAPDDTQERLAS